MTWHVLIKVYFVASLVLLLPIVAVLGWVVDRWAKRYYTDSESKT